MKNSRKYPKAAHLRIFIFTLALFLAGCGSAGGNAQQGGMRDNDGRETGGAQQSGQKTSVSGLSEADAYLPEFLTLSGENIVYSGMKLIGGSIYYLSDSDGEGVRQSLCSYSLADGQLTQVPLSWPEEPGGYLRNHTFTEDGSLYAIHSVVPEDSGGTDDDFSKFLMKFNPDGTCAGSWDITKQLREDNGGGHNAIIAADSRGRLYLAGQQLLWLYEGDGTYRGSLSLGGNSRINALGCDGEGRMYVSFHPEGNPASCTLARVDFEGKKAEEAASGFPYCSGSSFSPSSAGHLLVQDETALYEYDMENKKRKTVLTWADCGVGGSWASGVSLLQDGRLLAMLNDWEGGSSGVVLLTGTNAEDAPQKETIVIGTLYLRHESQEAADKFNMKNEKYNIQIKEYADETALNLDIVSGRCPDIIEFGNLHAEYLIEKGMFEDLTPYLEAGGLLSREDFFEGILDAYVFDGIQVAIPSGFEMNTVVGRSSDVGTEIGWTLDEMLDFADAHPEAELFDDSKRSVMMNLMRYNESLFVDWETGSCSFDSDRFRRLLEFVNSGPKQPAWMQEGSVTGRIKKGEVLLMESYLYFDELQVWEEIFRGEVTMKGLPTPGATSGATAVWSSAYGITAKSQHKEVAWEFLETFFTQSKWYTAMFPGLKSRMEPMILQSMKIDHDGIEYGEYIGEIDGEPYTYRAATQEEVDRVLELIDRVEPLSAQCDWQIQNIISEEAEAYYEGQKTVEEVMQVIQGRVQMYVSERM